MLLLPFSVVVHLASSVLFFFIFHLELPYVSSYNSVNSVAPPSLALYFFFAIQKKTNGSTYIAEIYIISAALENSIPFMAFAKRKKKQQLRVSPFSSSSTHTHLWPPPLLIFLSFFFLPSLTAHLFICLLSSQISRLEILFFFSLQPKAHDQQRTRGFRVTYTHTKKNEKN